MTHITLLFVITFLFVLTGCGPAPTNQTQTTTPTESTTTEAPVEVDKVATTNSECQYRVGFEAWEPYQFVDIQQQPAGLDIEILQALAAQMNCQLVMTQGNWTDLVTALKEGQLDVLPAASKTIARENFAHFSKPYRNEKFVLFVRSANTELANYNSLAEFIAAGRKVGIVSDYYYGEELSELYANPQMKTGFVEAALSELNLQRLNDEEIDGMFEDSLVGTSMLRKKGLSNTIGQHSIHLGQTDVYLMFSKQTVQEPVVEQFNTALDIIRGNGTYQAILAKYQ